MRPRLCGRQCNGLFCLPQLRQGRCLINALFALGGSDFMVPTSAWDSFTAVATAIDLLQEGLSLHRRGAVAEAAAHYSALLAAEPRHADAHYYLGLIACQQGRFAEGTERAHQALAVDPGHTRAYVLLGRALAALGHNEEALASFDRALALASDVAQVHGHRADTLSDLGRHGEAVEAYDRALVVAPDRADDWFNRGVALATLRRHREAVASFERANALRPGDAQIHLHRAKALLELRHHQAALDAVDAVLAIDPSLADAWLGRGNILHGLKRSHDALAAYERALTFKPDLAAAWSGRGNVLCEVEQFEAALSAYGRALAIEPTLSNAWLGRGNVFFQRQQHNFETKQYDDAAAAYERALALQPDSVAAWHGRGNVLREIKRDDDALAAYDKALALDPGFTDAWHGRGNALYAMRRDAEALSCFDKAISLNKDFAQAYYGKSLVKLTLGDYEEGWKLYEWRWRSQLANSPKRDFGRPLWLGDRNIENKTILIHAEQGLGDTIQFYRYLRLFDPQTCRIVFEVPPALLSLLREQNQEMQIIARGDSLPDFDLQCPLMSLPLAFRTTLRTVPAEVRYLFASEEKREKWRARLGEKSKARVGLAWSGNLHPDPARSIPLGKLLPLLSEEVEWHSLQKEVCEEDREHLVRTGRVVEHSADFSNTAALISEMDLVISIDTAAAHLAGALGKEVWIMLPYHADFRWLRDRHDCPWYPTAKLFRQTKNNEWGDVIDEVAEQLRRQHPSIY